MFCFLACILFFVDCTHKSNFYCIICFFLQLKIGVNAPFSCLVDMALNPKYGFTRDNEHRKVAKYKKCCRVTRFLPQKKCAAYSYLTFAVLLKLIQSLKNCFWSIFSFSKQTLLSRVAYAVAYEVPELLGKLQKYEQVE